MYSNIIILAEGHVVHKLPLPCKELQKIIYSMLVQVQQTQKTIELTILNDAHIENLNNKELHLTGPTNILAFPTIVQNQQIPPNNVTETAFLGSLALSVDTLLRECFLYNQEPAIHCVRLLAHGVAHLLGYDHGDTMDAVCQRLETAGQSFFDSP